MAGRESTQDRRTATHPDSRRFMLQTDCRGASLQAKEKSAMRVGIAADHDRVLRKSRSYRHCAKSRQTESPFNTASNRLPTITHEG
jgi:hypothetical protein